MKEWVIKNATGIFIVTILLLGLYILLTIPFLYGEYKTYDNKGNLTYCKGDWKYCTTEESLVCKTIYTKIKNL
jgi:hypothetical protein